MLRRILCSLLIIILALLSVSVSFAKNKEDEKIAKVIQEYYRLAYRSVDKLKVADFSKVLNGDTLFSRNFRRHLGDGIESSAYILKKDYDIVPINDLPEKITIKSIKRDDIRAIADVFVDIGENFSVPWFVCNGHSKFILEKNKGKWLIESVEIEGEKLHLFLNEKEFPYVSKEKLHKKIDKEYEEISDSKTSAIRRNTIFMKLVTDVRTLFIRVHLDH